jgi:hypothetical protein
MFHLGYIMGLEHVGEVASLSHITASGAGVLASCMWTSNVMRLAQVAEGVGLSCASSNTSVASSSPSSPSLPLVAQEQRIGRDSSPPRRTHHVQQKQQPDTPRSSRMSSKQITSRPPPRGTRSSHVTAESKKEYDDDDDDNGDQSELQYYSTDSDFNNAAGGAECSGDLTVTATRMTITGSSVSVSIDDSVSSVNSDTDNLECASRAWRVYCAAVKRAPVVDTESFEEFVKTRLRGDEFVDTLVLFGSIPHEYRAALQWASGGGDGCNSGNGSSSSNAMQSRVDWHLLPTSDAIGEGGASSHTTKISSHSHSSDVTMVQRICNGVRAFTHSIATVFAGEPESAPGTTCAPLALSDAWVRLHEHAFSVDALQSWCAPCTCSKHPKRPRADGMTRPYLWFSACVNGSVTAFSSHPSSLLPIASIADVDELIVACTMPDQWAARLIAWEENTPDQPASMITSSSGDSDRHGRTGSRIAQETVRVHSPSTMSSQVQLATPPLLLRSAKSAMPSSSPRRTIELVSDPREWLIHPQFVFDARDSDDARDCEASLHEVIEDWGAMSELEVYQWIWRGFTAATCEHKARCNSLIL